MNKSLKALKRNRGKENERAFSKQAIWSVTAAYAVFMLIIGLVNNKRTKQIGEFTVGSRNAGGWLSAMSYSTACFSAVMFIGYAGNPAGGWRLGGTDRLGQCDIRFAYSLARTSRPNKGNYPQARDKINAAVF